MNTIPRILLLFTCLVFTTAAFGQYGSRSYGNSGPDQAFAIGVAPISLFTGLGKFNVRGEWAYADNKSLSLLVNVPCASKVPNYLSKNVDVVDGNSVSNKFKTLGFTLENRFYIGTDQPRGFYLAPYARYNRYQLSREIENTANATTTTINGSLYGIGVGGAAGVQFRMGNHMTMDITFLGLDAKFAKGALRYQSNDPENDIYAFRDQVEASLNDIPLIGKVLTPKIDGDQIKVRTPGFFLPGYRFNMTVNYVF